MEDVRAKKFIFKIIQVDRLHRNVLDKQVKKFNLYRSQHHLLRYLMHVNEPPSQREIAENLDITAAATATTIKKLEKDGLIEKLPLKKDKRIKLIKISPRGRKIMNKTMEISDNVDKNVINNIEKKDLDIAFKVLSKIETNLIDMGAVDPARILFKVKNTGLKDMREK